MVFSQKIKKSTKGFCDLVDISEEVERIVAKSKIKNGLVCVFVTGSTAGITTIEHESGVVNDFKKAMEKIAPESAEYEHNEKWGDGNGFSHVRSSLLRAGLAIPLIDSKLTLGTWQQVVLADFDNRPREREVVVQVLGEN